jgi:hypothetical protein
VTLEATASDATAGVAGAEFQVSPGGEGSWTTIATDGSAPFSVAWDTLTVDDGRYDLRVIATDRAGNVAVSAVVRNRQVTNHPPIVSITSPDGAFVTAGDADPFTIEATSPSPNLRHVEFFSCSDASVSCSTGTWLPLGLDDTAPYAAAWPVDPDGNRALKAVVTNLSWAEGTDVNNVLIDRTPPSGGSISYPDGYDADGSVAVTTAHGSDAGSGVDTSSGITERQTAPLADGACGTFGEWTGAPANPDTIPQATCARYRYHVLDEAGNRATYTAAAIVKVDLTAPTTPALTLAETESDQHADAATMFYNPSGANSGSFGVSATSSDPESGIDAVEFPAVFGADGGTDPSQPYDATYSWTNASTAAGDYTVTVRNAAGLDASATFSLRPDTAAPSLTVLQPADGLTIRDGQGLAASATDALSGPREIEFRYCAGEPCDWSIASPIAAPAGTPFALDWTGQPADGDYILLARAVDHVDNVGAIEARSVVIDNTAPAVAILEPSGYANADAPDPLRVTATSPDAIASIEIFRCDDASADCATGTWVSLGTSASSPFSVTTAEPEGARAFRAVAVDGVGNSTAMVSNVIVDRTAPTGPSLSSSHATDSWSGDNTVDVAFASADGVSGLDGFSYAWDTDPAGVPDTTKEAEETAGGTTSPALADGAWYFHVRSVDNAGNWGGAVHLGPLLIDTTAATDVSVGGFALLRPVQLATSFAVFWSATDGTAFDVRYRRAAASGTFGPHLEWQASTTSTTATFIGSPGSTYCFSARAVDGAGNVSDWSAEKCTALPLDNTALSHSAGWTKKRAAGHYLGTYSVSSRRGASLARTNVGATRIAVVVTKCRSCGVLGMYWNGTLLRRVNLAALTTAKKQLIQAPLFSTLRRGTVKLVVLSSGKPVMVDGLAVSPL